MSDRDPLPPRQLDLVALASPAAPPATPRAAPRRPGERETQIAPAPRPGPQPTDPLGAVLSGGLPGRVVVRDAFELLAALPDQSVDLIITDPPYQSLELHRARGTTTRLTTNWFTTVPDERLPELLAQAARVLKPDRHLYLFSDEVTADVIKHQQGIAGERLPTGARRAACGLAYWREIIWAKTTLDGARIRGGTGYHYRSACERILFFEKGKRALADLGVPDVLLAPRPQLPGPAVKPAALVRTLIAQSSAPGELVLDPFCGSGVVGVEARAAGRRFLLGDLDLAWLDPSLADAAPPGLPRAPGLQPEEGTEALAPPPLEELAARAGADGAVRAAAEAAGWLDRGAPTEEMALLLAVRPKERDAAVRRALRSLEPRALVDAAMEGGEAGLSLVQSWRAWALRGRG
jgi:site-specific DNA-methyltransferase (adenine-specific)